MATYFVRMDSAIDGRTLAASRFEADTAEAAREIARSKFSYRLKREDCGDMGEDMIRRILELDAANGEAMAQGVTFKVRKVN